MMSPGGTVMETPGAGSGGITRTPCPLYGCKRVYSDQTSLESHIKDHEISAQSLPGKDLLCSTVGCSGSFPNMQKLMEHMRHHHKPNIFFLCESCRTKLRSYRGLLTHLHTCSKVSRGRPKPAEPMAPPPAAVTGPTVTPMDTDQKPPLLDFVSTPQQQTSPTPNPEGSFLTAVLKTESAPPLLISSSMSMNPELYEAASQSLIKSEPSDWPLNLDGKPAAPDNPEAQGQHLTLTRSPEPIHAAPGTAPCAPPGITAVWRKSQGMTCSRRILWEHTKGRYTCVQCGHTVSNRKEMTQHINSKHSGNKAAEDTGSSTTSA